MQKNQLTYFSKTKKLLKSTYGARRTVMLKYLDEEGVPTNCLQTLWRIEPQLHSATHVQQAL